MKKYFALFVFILISMSVTAQNEFADVIKTTLNNYQKALLTKDYAKATSLLHPKIVTMAGGEELYEKILKDEYERNGSKLVDFNTLDPETPVVAGDELHCIVPQEVTLNFGGTNFKGVEHLLAASVDNGNSWYFVELKTFDKESLKTFISNYNDDLAFPQSIPLEEVK